MQELEQRADSVDKQNTQLRDEVAKLKEESIYLRNLLLTHGDCNCESVVSTLKKYALIYFFPTFFFLKAKLSSQNIRSTHRKYCRTK